ADVRDLRAAAGGIDPVRVLLVVDVGSRPELAVEDDREVLRVLEDGVDVARPALARLVRELLAALRLEARDVVELLVPLALEAELHDVALALRADIRLDRGEVQVVAVRLRNRVLRTVREVLEQVVVRPSRARGARTAVRRRRSTADHCLVLGYGEHLPALRHLAVEPRRVEQLLTGVLGALLELVLRVEEVEGGRRAVRLH